MENKERTLPRTLEHHIAEMLKSWRVLNPQALKALCKQNDRLDNFLLKTKNDRVVYLKEKVIFLPKSGKYLLKSEFKKGG